MAAPDKTRKRVTQRDIAQAVGVSHVAVSHVLHRSHKARISPETRQEILRVARQMGYEPRFATTHTIALVVEPESLWMDVTTNVLTAADELLRRHGYRMSVATLGPDTIHTAPELFNQKTVDGVIFTEWFGARSTVLHTLRVPWLLLADTTGLPANVDQVALDTVRATRRLTEHLLRRGHRRISVVTGVSRVGFHDRVVQGAREALHAAGLPEENLLPVHDREGQEVEDELLRRLRKAQPPTGVVAGSPGNVLVLLNRLQRAGYRVPEDVSLVSLIDSPRLAALQPRVTATTALGRENVKTAVERLLARIQDPELEPRRIAVAGRIIQRGSVARPA